MGGDPPPRDYMGLGGDFCNCRCTSNPSYIGGQGLLSNILMGHRLTIFIILTFLITTSAASAQESQTSEDIRQVVHNVVPVYPELARRMQISGAVKLRATIARNGSVKSIEAVGGNPLLIKAAQEAVANWKYSPAPNESRVLIELHFRAR